MARRSIGRYVGEFALIVAGVVTALVAEEWVSGVRERLQAGEIRMRLVEDLSADAYEDQRRVTFYSRVSDRARGVLADLSSGEDLRDPVAFLVRAFDASRVYPLPESRPTWDDLAATGRLGILEAEVRRAVSQHYRNRSNGNALANDLSTAYRQRVRSIVPVSLQDFSNRDCEWFSTLDEGLDKPCDFQMDADSAAALVATLRRDEQLRLDLTWYLSQITTSILIFEGAASESQALADALESR